MTSEHPVVWDEGMLLVPQHFQQWDRSVRALMRDRIAGLHPRGWGFTSLEVDAEALRAGEFRLTGCAGVLRSGLPFRAPDRDPLPVPRAFGDAFDPRAGHLMIHLARPDERPGSPACSSGEEEDGAAGGGSPADGAPTPWRRRILSLPDANLPNSVREVPVALPNLRLVLGGEPLEEHEFLPVARVIQASGGGFELDGSFVPTCLQLSASPRLRELLRSMIEILSRKSQDLVVQRRGTGGMAEAATLWLLHTVNSHLPRLMHLEDGIGVHPETLYLELASLSGELCTFAGGMTHPRELPAYTHEDLGGCMGRLEDVLRRLLDAVIPHRCIPVPLERPSDTLFTASVPDASLLAGQLYLAVGADMDEERLVREFPMKAKISSRDRVQQLLMMAVPGLAARHVPNPPEDIPVQPGRSYFRLEKDGEHWQAMESSQTVALHVPPEFPGLRLELMVVKESA